MNKHLQRLLWLTVMLVGTTGWMHAQRTITGTVKDESGEPMIGVNILVMGTNVGTVSDFDGGYTLQVPEGATQLQYTYTGYDRVLVNLASGSVIDVVMGEGAILEDVVVTGYGTVRREDVTGSIQTVRAENFNRGAITSPQDLITGKVAGVQVVNNGEPGGGAVIRIRGGSSLSATNDPLIIIDGVPVANELVSGSRNILNVINPNDIETFTVLKDASATAIYGSRASNGVVIITTKKGTLSNKPLLEYNGSIATSTIAKRVDVYTADELRSLVTNQIAVNSPNALNVLDTFNTDWQDAIFQNGLAHDHNLSLRGSLSDIPYRLSLGYSDKEGMILTDHFKRLTYGLNLTPGFLDNTLQVNLSFKGMNDQNVFADQGAMGAAVFFDPTKPVYSGDTSRYGGYYTWLDSDGNRNTLSPANPLALLELTDATSTVNRFILGGQIDYRLPFLPDMRANLNLALDQSDTEGSKFIPAYASFAESDGGRNERYTQEIKNKLLEFFLNYNREISTDFGVDLMAGYSWQHFYFQNFFEATNATGEDTLTDADFDTREHYLVSVFGRANINFLEDWLLTLTVRRDGTSRFAEDNRWGTFPGAALGWKMVNNNAGAVNNLKLRVGYGVTGQQDLFNDFYPYLPRYRTSRNDAQYIIGNDTITTLRPEGYDANIKWEETTTFNIGVDYGLFDDRLTGSLEYYIRKTEDLINFVPVAAGTNLTNFLLTNVGDMENRGVEFSINAIPWRKGGKEWGIGFNAAFNENEITKLTATDDPNYIGVLTAGITGAVGNNIQIHSVGKPAYSYYVYEQVYDAAGIPLEGVYVDRNGDGAFTPEDQYHYKQATPDVTLGMYTTVDLGRFDLSAAAHGSIGNYVYNNNQSNAGTYQYIYNTGGGGYLNNALDGATVTDFNQVQYFSDHYVQDGSFLRIDHITAGYDFGGLGNAISALRLSATVQNPFLFTNYDGIDPEIAVRGLDNRVTFGVDSNIYPRSRTFLLGLNVQF
jgi:TonB-linked SusC/RagA family outer membrane protein